MSTLKQHQKSNQPKESHPTKPREEERQIGKGRRTKLITFDPERLNRLLKECGNRIAKELQLRDGQVSTSHFEDIRLQGIRTPHK